MLSLLATLVLPLVSAQYTATYVPTNLPDKSEQPGQIGTNNCGTESNQSSLCQNVYINSVDDFCLWGPPYEGSRGVGDGTNKIGNIEQIVVAYVPPPTPPSRSAPITVTVTTSETYTD